MAISALGAVKQMRPLPKNALSATVQIQPQIIIFDGSATATATSTINGKARPALCFVLRGVLAGIFPLAIPNKKT